LENIENIMKTIAELRSLYNQPLLELIAQASDVHRQYRGYGEIQRCALLSIKTGGCPEDCAYCPQSAHYATPVTRQALLTVEEVRQAAEQAKAAGATRFCMGAAWRSPPKEGPEFERVLEMVRTVRSLGLEACVTLGMLTADQARRLKEAGLTAYNHNLDTSRRFYPNIITTRTYDDRLATLRAVSQAGISICCGGIIGMGESIDDRLLMLVELSQLQPPPESIPINCLIPIPGTPLEKAPPVPVSELVRLIAVTRITFPHSRIRLSAGRDRLSQEAQILCFLAGADSIFYGEKLLTAPNPNIHEDMRLLNALQPIEGNHK
jgi:biotin synthase